MNNKDLFDDKNEWEEPETSVTEAVSDIQPMSVRQTRASNTDSAAFSDIKEYPEDPFSYAESSHIDVQLSSGNIQYDVTDFVLPGRDGFDVVIARKYDSGSANQTDMDPHYSEKGNLRTGSRKNNHNIQIYGLGYGWSFTLPSIEAVPYLEYLYIETEDGYRYYDAFTFYDQVLHLEDGRNLNIRRDKDAFHKYELNDVTIKRESGTVPYPYETDLKKGYNIVINYKNGNKDYFRYKSRKHPESSSNVPGYELVARQDKYNNVIGFEMTDYGGMVIVDTWGRKLTLEKTDNILTWKLPSGSNGEACQISYQVDQLKPERLISATSLSGNVTRYDYNDPAQFTGKMKYLSRLYIDQDTEVNLDTKEQNRPYMLLKSITYPNGGSTQFTYGESLKVENDAKGYITHYPVTMKCDMVGTQKYNWSTYYYSRSSTGKYLNQTKVTSHDDITEVHHFSSSGLLNKKEVRHMDICISKSTYKYDYNTKQILSSVDRIVERKADEDQGNGGTGSGGVIWSPSLPTEDENQDGLKSLTKKTFWTYSSDKKGNITKLVEEYPDEPEYNQEIKTTYGDYSIVTSVTRKSGSNIVKETNELSQESGNRVVKCKRIFENDVLKEKVTYDYTDGSNPYRTTSEKRYVLKSGSDLEQSGDYAESAYSYDSRKYTHQPVSMEQKHIKDADGNSCAAIRESYNYDNWGRMISKTDARNQVMTIRYDKSGRVIEEKLPPAGGQQMINRTSYYDQQCYIVKTDAANQKIRIHYNPFGKLDKVYLAVAETPHSADVLFQSYHYNSWGELTEVNKYDGNGTAAGNIRKTETYTYDSFGRVLSRKIPQVGYEETICYEEMFFDTEDQVYRLREQTTIKGDNSAPDMKTECYKDQNGLIRKEFVAGKKMFVYEYDNSGNNIRKTDTRNYVEQLEYDYAGRVLKCTQTAASQQRITRQEYDALGNQRFSWDEAGMKTEMQYDYAGRVTQIIYPFDHRSRRVKYYYDATGNVICEKKERSDGWQEITNVYDEAGRLTDTCQYLSQNNWIRTCYQYDVLGNVTWMRNGDTPSGNGAQVIRYTYDRFGNVLMTTDACGRKESNQYDKVGRLVTKTDRNGNRTTWQYDALDRPLKVTVTAQTPDRTVTSEHEYRYSKTGKVLYESNRETAAGYPTVLLESRYTYDARGQLLEQVDPGTVKKVYSYDYYGNRQSFRLNRNNQSSADISLYYLYDMWDRLKQVRKDSSGGTVLAEYEYDVKGNRTVLRNPQAGIVTRYQYNYNNQVIVLESKRNGAVISSWEHVYGVDGNLLSKTNKASSPTVTITYQYDGLGRLTEENDPSWKRTLYTYDQYSNRIKMMVEGKTKDEPVSVTSYQYDNSNRLELETKKQGKVTELHRYCYDANGNETFRILEKTAPRPDYPGSIKLSGDWKQGRPTVYVWRHYNGFNQLIKINQDEQEIDYQYRADGLRHSCMVRKLTESKGETTILCWDGNDIVAEQLDGSKLKSYLRGNGLIAKEISGVVYYYVLNFHGDVEQLWNVNGARKALYVYDGFGVEKDLNDKDENPFRYCGEYFDVETETVYLRARDYRASTGRFTSQDPINAGLNWYTYCSNNPVTFIDPSGCLTVSQYPSFLRQFATEGLGIAWDNLSTNLLESLQDARDTANAIYETGRALATGEITIGELASAMGQSAWDGLSGDVRYLIDNYTLFDPSLKLTDEQLTELAHRSAGAYEESVQIGAILYAGVEKAKSIKNSGKSWYKPDGSFNYPPNNGAVPGTELTIDLKPGQSLGRYGNIGPNSNYVTAPGASPDSLSLPPNTSPSIYTELQVVKTIPGVTQSTVAPWGGSTGLGLQYELPMPIQDLIKQGYLVIK